MRIVYETGQELWSSLFIHRIELVALPEEKVVAQLLPASEVGTTFLTEGLELVWSEDSKWCAFYFAYPGRGGDPSGHTIVFRESGGNFVATNKPNQLRSASLDRDAESRLNEDVMPVRWTKPGNLLLKQRAEIVADSETETTWRLEVAYDPKIHAMHLLDTKELSAEETEKFNAEIQAMRGKE